jgi:esterase/lipase
LAARTLDDVYKNYDKYLSKSDKQAKINSEKFSLDKMQKALDEFLTKTIPTFPKKQQIVLPKLKKVELPTLV